MTTTQLNWFFGPSGLEEQGPKDSMEYHFKGNKYYSIAREAIQNSLDAVLDDDKPVLVKFNLMTVEKSQLPALFEINKTIEKCKTYFHFDKFAGKTFSHALEVLSKPEIKCLKIGDYNTIGLEFNSENPNMCPFYAFMKAVGVNFKRLSGSGGSFGFGKGAYYAASALNAIIVSSIFNDGEYIFQGKTRLTTHLDEFDRKKGNIGLFGINEGSPVMDKSLIPDIFKRDEKGTDIIVVGFHEEPDWKEVLIKSILNNFWFSIYDKKLIVEIEDQQISNKNIEEFITKFYSENDNDGSVNEPEKWNPYPYFKAVKYKNELAGCEYFEDSLETLGKVEFFLMAKESFPSRTVYLRKPKMIIQKITKTIGINYAGVFVCDNDKGNEILRKMEPPQHNAWKKNNYEDGDLLHPEGVKADEELKKFVNGCLDSIAAKAQSASQRIMGLEEYLNIPEDLLSEYSGDGEGTGGGDQSGEISKKETALERPTKDEKSTTVCAKAKKVSHILIKDKAQPDDEGENEIFTGRHGENDGPIYPNPEPGPFEGKKKIKGKPSEKNVRKPLKISYRAFAQEQTDGSVEYILKIYSKKNVSANLEIYVGVDNESDGSEDGLLKIASAKHLKSDLKFRENEITDISLLSTEPTVINFKLKSSQKHSIRVKSYES